MKTSQINYLIESTIKKTIKETAIDPKVSSNFQLELSKLMVNAEKFDMKQPLKELLVIFNDVSDQLGSKFNADSGELTENEYQLVLRHFTDSIVRYIETYTR